MPLRYFVIAALVCAAIVLFKRQRRRGISQPSTRKPIQMVRCRFCGTHLADRDAVILPVHPDTHGESRYYCSLAHAKEDQKPRA